MPAGELPASFRPNLPRSLFWRYLDRSATWDYLRENNFFREPSAAAESP